MSVQKAVVSVGQMAELVSLSRARFYELIEAGVFPPPVHCVKTRRPLYVRELQEKCLTVRRSGLGIDGRPVLFYDRKPKGRRPTPRPKRPPASAHDFILAGVRGLGLKSATAAEVGEAAYAAFPGGTAGTDPAEVVRRVFLHLARQGG